MNKLSRRVSISTYGEDAIAFCQLCRINRWSQDSNSTGDDKDAVLEAGDDYIEVKLTSNMLRNLLSFSML